MIFANNKTDWRRQYGVFFAETCFYNQHDHQGLRDTFPHIWPSSLPAVSTFTVTGPVQLPGGPGDSRGHHDSLHIVLSPVTSVWTLIPLGHTPSHTQSVSRVQSVQDQHSFNIILLDVQVSPTAHNNFSSSFKLHMQHWHSFFYFYW